MKIKPSIEPIISSELRKDSINKMRSAAAKPINDLHELAINYGPDRPADGLTGCKEGTDKEKDGSEGSIADRLRLGSMTEPQDVGIQGRLGRGQLIC